MKEDKTVDCLLCGGETTKIGTKLCDRCWELKTRIEANPTVARLVMRKLDTEILKKEVAANPELSRVILADLSKELEELQGLKNES